MAAKTMWVLRFTKYWDNYAIGEIAGFEEAQAQRLIVGDVAVDTGGRRVVDPVADWEKHIKREFGKVNE